MSRERFFRSRGEIIVMLEIDLCGIQLKNPTILASGVLGISGSLLSRVLTEGGAGAVVTKSVGPVRTGFPNPTVVEVEAGFLNAMGLPNPGIEEFIKEDLIPLANKGPIFASIFGSDSEEFARNARLIEPHVQAIELNVSCPHVQVGQIGQDASLTKEVVSAVKKAVKIPIFCKLTPNVAPQDLIKIARAAQDEGADAITAINTVRAMAIDINIEKPILANRHGGLSGPAIKPIAIRAVYDLATSLDIPIIGVGGITTWEDAVEFFLAGASAIQIGTGIAWKEITIFKSVCEGIKHHLKRKGYANVSDLIKRAHRSIKK